MTHRINIVTDNHSEYRGISDYVHYLKYTLNEIGCDISESFEPQVNVDANSGIEEFGYFDSSSEDCVKRLC